MADAPKVKRMGDHAVFSDLRIGASKARPEGFLVGEWCPIVRHQDSGASSRVFTLSDYKNLGIFDDLKLSVRRLVPGTDDRQAYFRVNGSSANYQWENWVHNFGGTASQAATTQAQIALGNTVVGGAFGTGTGEVAQMDFICLDWQDTTKYKIFEYSWRSYAATPEVSSGEGCAAWASTAALTSITFLMEASATYSAILTLSGRRNA